MSIIVEFNCMDIHLFYKIKKCICISNIIFLNKLHCFISCIINICILKRAFYLTSSWSSIFRCIQTDFSIRLTQIPKIILCFCIL